MRLLHWVKKEILHVLPIFLFFLFFFTVINWVEAFAFEKSGFTPFGFLEIAIAAALIAKVVMVVDHFRWTHRFRKKPLAYSILWKTALYWICLIIIRLSMRFIPFLFGYGDHFIDDFHRFSAQMNWRLFVSIQAYYCMLLFIFVTFQELNRKIGSSTMRKLFFG